MTVLQIEYPQELLDQADQTKEALEDLAREALLVRLYDLGKLSSWRSNPTLESTMCLMLSTPAH